MSLELTRTTTRVTKTTHVTAIAAGLVALPVALLLAAAYGPTVVHLVHRAFFEVGTGGSNVANLSLDAVFAVFMGVMIASVALAVRERRNDQDKETFDIR